MELRTDDIRFLPGPREQWAQYALAPGDLLFTRYNGTRSLVGVCAVVPDPIPYRVYPDKLIRVRVDPRQAVPKYIEKAVHVGASREAIDQSLKTSAGQVGISGAQLKEVPIPLAPLDQQRRIVEKIEAFTAKSRRAEEALDAIPPLLERFRQSVLAAAFRGDLTKDWREQNPDVEPADQLLARIRRERRARWEQAELEKLRAKGKVPKGDEWKKKYVEPEPADTAALPELPDGWCWGTLEAVTDPVRVIRYGILMPGPEKPGGVPYVKVKHMRGDSIVPLGELPRTTKEMSDQFAGALLGQGDLLLSIRGTYGRVALVPDELAGANITQDSARVAPLAGINREFLAAVLRSPESQRFFNKIAKGVAVRGINIGEIRPMPIPIAPAAEQARVAAIVGRSLDAIAVMGAAVVDASKRQTALDQAVLAKAFRGELVNPNEARSVGAQAAGKQLELIPFAHEP